MTRTPASVAAVLLLQGCTLMSMSRSPLRDPEPERLRLSEQVEISSTGAINMYVFGLVDHVDLVPSGFKVASPATTLYIDPVLVDDEASADYIFITHAHGDHLSLADIDKLSHPGTLILCPAAVATELGSRRHRVVAPGEALALEGVNVEAIAAYNTHALLFDIAPHPRDQANVGFLIEVAGVRIFHAGDSHRTPEMRALERIDVALLPIAGGDLTMSTQEAADLAHAMKPRTVVPMHYPIDSGEAERFRSLVDPDIEVKVLQPRHRARAR